MKTKTLAALLLCAATAILSACGPSAGPAQPAPQSSGQASAQEAPPPAQTIELTVSAAASLTDVMNELFTLYRPSGYQAAFMPNYGASGTLQTQIEEGAPADLFFSAAQKQMNALEEKGLLLDGARKDLLQNKVVLIVPKGNAAGIASFADAAEKAKTIALGEPKGVPVGQYSEEIFTSLGLLDQVKTKAAYGSDVRQVLTWVESGEADCGVVYATDAAASADCAVVCEAPEGSCKPVVYPAAVLRDSQNPQAAKAFLDFLSTDEAKAVFEKYGFTAL